MRWALLTLAAAGMTDAATAQPIAAGGTQTAAAQRTETCFAPPLRTVQRFRLTVTKRGETHSWVEEVRFERDGDTFVAHWRMDASSIPAAMRHPLLLPMIQPFTGAPVAFDVDADGTVVRTRDWPTQQSHMLKSIEASRPLIVAASGADKKRIDAVLGSTRAMFAQLDAQSGADIILKNIAPIFGWGGYGLTLGQPVSGSETVPVALLGTSIERHSTIELTALEPGRARITLRSEFDGAAMRSTLETLGAMGANGDAAAKARFAQSLAQAEQMRAVQATDVMLDLATGLPHRVEVVVSVDGKPRDRTIVEWLKH
jgi:hypothetical protein